MAKQRKLAQETRDRAVRMYREPLRTDPQESMIASWRHVGGLLGISAETTRGWASHWHVQWRSCRQLSQAGSQVRDAILIMAVKFSVVRHEALIVRMEVEDLRLLAVVAVG